MGTIVAQGGRWRPHTSVLNSPLQQPDHGRRQQPEQEVCRRESTIAHLRAPHDCCLGADPLCLMELAGSCHLHLVFWAGLLEQFVLVLPSCMVTCSTPGKEVWASCRRGHRACLLPPFSVPPPWSCSEDLSALHSESFGRHPVDTRWPG